MEDNQPPCRGLFGAIFGHKFRGRYSSHSIPRFPENAVELAKRPDLLQILKEAQENVQGGEELDVVTELCSNQSCDEETSTYHGDVCIRCGIVVNKQDQNA